MLHNKCSIGFHKADGCYASIPNPHFLEETKFQQFEELEPNYFEYLRLLETTDEDDSDGDESKVQQLLGEDMTLETTRDDTDDYKEAEDNNDDDDTPLTSPTSLYSRIMSFNLSFTIQSRTALLIGSSNYTVWAHQVPNILTMATWWSIVDGTLLHTAQADAATMALWESNDRQAQAMIAIFIHADMQHLQKDTYIAFVGPPANPHPSLSKDLWDQLNTLYSPMGIVGQFEAFSEALCIRI
ncbi:hypothetical protein OG21DRAFT_1486626 [Imleria badia]|nr:hypothetical protein OG21DRAFT_1486626 [Imleria badia]